jgi:anti-sigma B factor antagonist
MGSKITRANTKLASTLEVRRQPMPGALVLSASGELDASEADVMREALFTAIDTHERGQGDVIVVDLSQVSFIDSVGLGILVAGLKHAIERHFRLRFVVTHPQTQRVLNITGLSRIMEIYRTVEGAITGRSS